MSPLTILSAIWLGSAILVLVGALWVAFWYPAEGERSNTEDFASENLGDVEASSSRPVSVPETIAGSPEMLEMQSCQLEVENRRCERRSF